MAHGFLAYEPVSGESPLVNFAKKKLAEGLKGLWGKFQKTSGALVKSSGGQVQYQANAQGVTVKDVTKAEPVAKKMFSGSQPKMLGSGTTAITKQEPLAVPGGTDGGIAKRPGGTFTDIPGISSGGGLNAETFFKQATTGVGPSGEYLTNAQRREAFIKSRQESVKTTSAAAPPISPESGIDIVAAVNKNTQIIMSLVDAVKEQTKTEVQLSEKQQQSTEKLMLRAASREEEKYLEQGNDLSGFMTPENFAKRKKNEEKKETGSKLGKAVAKGLGKGFMKKIPVLGALAGGAFAAERAMSGDWLGAGGELLSGIASIIPGIGTAVSTGIDAGLMARDAGLTPFANGGIITSPVTGLIGEAGNEGVFPLEGTRGKKTFEMFGEGVFAAQKKNDKDFAKMQAMGMKQYYEREGGFEKMGEGLKSFFESLAGGIASLFGGAANAAEFNPAADYLGGGDFSGSSGQDQAMNYFMSQGLTKDQAAGIVGNLMQESGAGLDPMAKNKTGHRGLAQWDKNRWANFEKWAKQKGLDVNTREAQLQWIMEEMRTGSGGLGIERFKKTKTAAEAAALFVKDFERSGEKPGQAGYDSRIRNANTLAPPWGASMYVPDAEKKMVGAGYQQVSYGQRQPGDVMVMYDRQSPPQAHIGVVLQNGKILSNSSSKAKFSWEASPEEYNAYYGGQGKIYRMPGGASRSTIARNRGNQSVSAAPAQPLSINGKPDPSKRNGQTSATRTSPRASSRVSPGALQASAANPNTGTPMMAASQQVAMNTMGLTTQGGGATIINNYYGGGGNQQGGINGNGVSPGIGMEQTGTAVFQDLRIRALA